MHRRLPFEILLPAHSTPPGLGDGAELAVEVSRTGRRSVKLETVGRLLEPRASWRGGSGSSRFAAKIAREGDCLYVPFKFMACANGNRRI